MRMRLTACCARACETLYDVLYPPRCAFCALGAGHICTACLQDLATNLVACARCATPLGVPGHCAACLKTSPPWSRAYVPWRYAFPLDDAIKQFKFHHAQHYVPMFTQLLRACCKDLPNTLDGIQPMPLHWRRHAWRGFNQATELARPISTLLAIPLVDHVRRRVHSMPQSSLRFPERQRILDAHFQVRGRVAGKHLLVVDDVLTTGASVAAVSRCLLQAGAREVSVLALARA